ncbi:hypothetical protein ACIA8E_29275 [Streptomyces sp. NPDC051664]|uniref:hypothetical protein n=1 Tax=Streptomyces sp. NPDC051664 TaxID=3365668 RepID=UPI0037AF6C7F
MPFQASIVARVRSAQSSMVGSGQVVEASTSSSVRKKRGSTTVVRMLKGSTS